MNNTYSEKNSEKRKIRTKTEFLRTSRHGLSLLEYRVIYFAILRGQQENRPFSPVTLSVNEYKKLLGLKGESSYSEIKRMGNSILNKKVIVEQKDKEGNRLLDMMVWVKSFSYNEKEGTVNISPNSDIAKYWIGTPYKEVDFIYLIRFKCQYTERIYELLNAFRYKDKADFSLADLRNKLGLDENQYTAIYDFKRRVLNPVIKDINEITDMFVSYEEIKGGNRNRTKGIIFHIREKKKQELLEEPIPEGLSELLDNMGKDDIVVPVTEAEFSDIEDPEIEEQLINADGTIPEQYFGDDNRLSIIISSLTDALSHGGNDLFFLALDELIIMCGSSYNEKLNQRDLHGRIVFDQINKILLGQKEKGDKPSLDKVLEKSADSYNKGQARGAIGNQSKYMRTCIANNLFYRSRKKDDKHSDISLAVKVIQRRAKEGLTAEEYS